MPAPRRHSSTSSSELALLKQFRWLGYAALFFAAYTAILPRDNAKIPDGLLTIFQAHRVVGEDFLMRTDRLDAVLVGSSLAAMLPQIGLQPVYNLAMSGGSALTGLRLVAASGHMPRVVFIEATPCRKSCAPTKVGELLAGLVVRLLGELVFPVRAFFGEIRLVMTFGVRCIRRVAGFRFGIRRGVRVRFALGRCAH